MRQRPGRSRCRSTTPSPACPFCPRARWRTRDAAGKRAYLTTDPPTGCPRGAHDDGLTLRPGWHLASRGRAWPPLFGDRISSVTRLRPHLTSRWLPDAHLIADVRQLTGAPYASWMGTSPVNHFVRSWSTQCFRTCHASCKVAASPYRHCTFATI